MGRLNIALHLRPRSIENAANSALFFVVSGPFFVSAILVCERYFSASNSPQTHLNLPWLPALLLLCYGWFACTAVFAGVFYFCIARVIVAALPWANIGPAGGAIIGVTAAYAASVLAPGISEIFSLFVNAKLPKFTLDWYPVLWIKAGLVCGAASGVFAPVGHMRFDERAE